MWIAISLLALQAPTPTAPAANEPLVLERTVPMPGVEGRLDHLALEAKGERLFVAALGNDSVEVLDLAAGKTIKSLESSEPQAVLLLPKHGRFVVSEGTGKGCAYFDLAKLERLKTVELGPDADNVRYDPATDLVWVAHGEGKLAAFLGADGTLQREIDLGQHVEAFQLEQQGPRMFANVPGAGIVAMCDREQGKVLARWRIGDGRENYPMALDEENQRVYVGCRRPGALLALAIVNGRSVGDSELSGDVDDLFIDAALRRLYAICGEGYVDVFDLAEPNVPKRTARIATRAGARTGLFVPERAKLYVAVPARDGKPAEVREFATKR